MKATVVIPTTTDRGPLLPYSIGSVLRQTIQELEVFVIGDGITEKTRQIVLQLQEKDDRIRLFDHPKHPRRGEEYRHAALQEAKGEIVAYLCDRDLMLPNHLLALYDHLQHYDFVSVNHFDVSRDQQISLGAKHHGYGPVEDMTNPEVTLGAHKLSSIGHTLAAYKALPEGWRTTPQDQATDRYMWRQFLENPGLKVFHDPHPTFLYFKRGGHPGWPTAKRLVELKEWSVVMEDTKRWEEARVKALGNCLSELASLRREKRSWLMVRGQKPFKFLKAIPKKINFRIRNRDKKHQW